MEVDDTLTEQSPTSRLSPPQKRRKLRKGTLSCWECKRRKARCVFSQATPDTCEGCKRRGADCISQEATDQPPPPSGSNKHIVDRLGQVEALIGQLIRANRQNGRSDLHALSPEKPETRSRSYAGIRSHASSPAAPVSASSSIQLQNDSLICGIGDSAQKFTAPVNVSQVAVEEDVSSYETINAISQGLLAVWPNQRDINIIMSIPVEASQITRAVACTRTDTSGSTLPSSATLFQLPPAGSHPALIARRLLILAIFLQSIPPSYAHYLEHLSSSCQLIMSRAVKTTHDLVSCNDDLVASMEGIECIMLEGLFENYAGNFRRSWLAARRAVMIGQMLGLNRGADPSSLAGSSLKADDAWFRLIQFDRYNSLMLGLPQSSLEDTFARPEVLESCTALDRTQRLCCAAAGRLLQRGVSEIYDSEKNEQIDKILQDASSAMPAQWWVTPTFSSDAGDVERTRETLRFNIQLVYYHLLLQLHIPYILCSSNDRENDYNRMAAITASREVLSRFMAYRTTQEQASRYYCRGKDMIAFISSTALCLAHICDQVRNGTGHSSHHFLAHQRLSDRGMLEQVFDVMQKLVDAHNDSVALRVATLLRHLLRIEDDMALGGRYIAFFASESQKNNDHNDDFGYRVETVENGTILKIYLPQFDVIQIKRQSSLETQQKSGAVARLQSVNQGHSELDRTELSGMISDQFRQNPTEAQLMPLSAEHRSGNGEFPRRADQEPPGLRESAGEMNWGDWCWDFPFLDTLIEDTILTDQGES